MKATQISAINASVQMSVPYIAILVMFSIHYFSGNQLTVSLVFTSIALLQTLTDTAAFLNLGVQFFSEGYSSTRRIQVSWSLFEYCTVQFLKDYLELDLCVIVRNMGMGMGMSTEYDYEYSVSVPNTTESNIPSIEPGNVKHNILVAGDSLLHRLDVNKMCVEQIKAKKLTKPGDTLNGTFSRIKDYASKHNDVQLEVLVLACTNDLNRRNVTPQSLIDQLVDHISVLKEFCNVKNIFVCETTPRCDRHVINSKVSEYNEPLDEHFSNQDSLTVLPTIPLEANLLYKDNLHLSVKGLCQVSGIILSNLYQVLAPNSYKPGLRRKSKSGRNAKSSNKAQNRK